ncbi:GNAT family N-acetyltransferase [Chitinophaga rhizophila]|uniref:GNAT family N-acetyltransferase n=1 Tax=Chitinophaga rhizophila TaxID=2866212 RepID=A0ABS7GD91_9BACT|nr:GNAT family N-acetyltransferase [Chitinophaga rhizophila]MBW8685645.1 GNAT family N-acetyltransferase [Chitinophaga rhizophila]
MQHFLPNGQTLLVRPATLEDAYALLALYQQLTQETNFLLMTKQEAASLTVADETAFLRSFCDKPQHLFLLAVVEGELVGTVSIRQSGFKKEKHLGQLGIAVSHAYWNMGIGRRLMTAALRWAEEHEELEIIHFNVFANNERAIQLYRNFGFMEYGRFQEAFRQPDGSYGDSIFMSKRIKNG